MAFKDGGTVKKYSPPPPNIDRPALGLKPVDNQNVPTHHGTIAPTGKPSGKPSKPDNAPIQSPITSNNPQETE